jgi:hypothetical protein
VSNNASKTLRNALGVALAAAALAPSDALAFDPFLVTPDAAVAERSPAFRYANASDADVFAELDRRKILYQRVDVAPGVRAPIRLTGRLHGVYIHSSLPPEQRVTSSFEILDGRLALALDDFAALLERHGIDEVIHYTMYRPNVAPPSTTATPPAALPALPTNKPAAKPSPSPTNKTTKTKPSSKPAPGPVAARAPSVSRRSPIAATPVASELHHTTWAPPGTRHPAGLAIDVGVLHQRSGRWINIGAKFHGVIGDKTCGDGARSPEDADARELRAIVCEGAALGIFTYVLTPNYNAAHADHFHMEVKPGVRWFLTH